VILLVCLSGDGDADRLTEHTSMRKRLRLELLGELQSTPTEPATTEINHYLSLRIPTEFEDDSLGFWKYHEKSFPILSKLAQVYFTMSSSSVPIECMFSTTGLISNGKRSSIALEKLNRVLFVHDNFSLITNDSC